MAARNTELAAALENLQASRQRLEVLEQLSAVFRVIPPGVYRKVT